MAMQTGHGHGLAEPGMGQGWAAKKRNPRPWQVKIRIMPGQRRTKRRVTGHLDRSAGSLALPLSSICPPPSILLRPQSPPSSSSHSPSSSSLFPSSSSPTHLQMSPVQPSRFTLCPQRRAETPPKKVRPFVIAGIWPSPARGGAGRSRKFNYSPPVMPWAKSKGPWQTKLPKGGPRSK